MTLSVEGGPMHMQNVHTANWLIRFWFLATLFSSRIRGTCQKLAYNFSHNVLVEGPVPGHMWHIA